MTFKKLATPQYPPRQWAILGDPGAGKSTFAARMTGPLLWIDADHRGSEVAHLAAQDVFTLSDDPIDHVDAERIAAKLRSHMGGSGVRTIIIDSLTAILTPLVTAAVLENDAGAHKNRVTAFKRKALSLRLLQDTITSWGVATLWVYHTRSGLDGQARPHVATSISTVELVRLRRSLNMTLRVVIDNNSKHGIVVDWARRGRSGMTLWDDSGSFAGMPLRIEAAVYDGLDSVEQDAIERATPTAFSGPADAVAWGIDQGCFRDAVHAQNAYDLLKKEQQPQTAAMMWTIWVSDVQARMAEKEKV